MKPKDLSWVSKRVHFAAQSSLQVANSELWADAFWRFAP
jgi:hypothetical protein